MGLVTCAPASVSRLQALATDVFASIEAEHPELLKSYRDLLKELEAGPTDGVRVASRGRPEIVNDMLMTGVRFSAGRGKGRTSWWR